MKFEKKNQEMNKFESLIFNNIITTFKLFLKLLKNKCKLKLQWGTTLHRSEWPSLKSLQITNAAERVEKRELSYSVGGNVNRCSTMENSMEVP